MKETQSKLSIYMIVIIIVLAMGTPLFFMLNRMMEMYEHHSYTMELAHMNASSYEFLNHKPLLLSGEWNVYEGLYLEGDEAEISNDYFSENIWLPTMNLQQSKDAQTYQMFLKLDISENVKDQLYLSIPLANSSIRVYINGHYVLNSAHDDSWLRIRSENGLYYMGSFFDPSLEYQEILVSVPTQTTLTNLYNRKLSVSTYSNYFASERVSQSIQLLLIGMMFTIIFVGLTYMVLVPSFTLLTLMNLFDATMMLHILFNMSTIPNIAYATMRGGNWGSYLFRQLDLGFFMLAGALGVVLGKEIFDSENRFNKLFDQPIICMYAMISLILAIQPELLNSRFVILIVAITIFAFLCIVARIIETIKERKMSKYRMFHVVKTVYIAGVILLDLTTLTSSNRNDYLMLILYAIFFLIHMFVKAYEYRLLFVNIEIMNHQLETTVEKRTKQLQMANKELHEISTKDALTRVHNRLYFEEKFDIYLQKLSANHIVHLHLCMFDLDGFKQINDTYGHVQGDEQLKETARIVFNYMDDTMEFARVGGEEFALLFIDKKNDEVLKIVENIRIDLETVAKRYENRTTGSFGIYKAKYDDENDKVYSNADYCMYYSKNHGKNQITYDFGDGMVNLSEDHC